jgi:hypothetical protein
VLERRLAAIASGSADADLAANEAALRLLCIQAELLTGTPGPPEDQDLRREHQMRRLVDALGNGRRAEPTELDDLALDWLAAGPVETAVYAALFARFASCRSARVAGGGTPPG